MTLDVTSTVGHTRDCKIPGCTDTAAHLAGPLALLCTKHADEKRQQPTTPKPTTTTSTGGGLRG